MKKYGIRTSILLVPIVVFCFPAAVYANSSWHWVTASPMTLFPFAVLLTLFLETMAIAKFGRVKNPKKVFLVVAAANLLSFLAPYIERAYRFIPTSGGFRLWSAFEKGPYYMVLSGYLLLTVIIELPVVYLLLRKESGSRKWLAGSILVSNIVTTLAVAIIERLACIGSW